MNLEEYLGDISHIWFIHFLPLS